VGSGISPVWELVLAYIHPTTISWWRSVFPKEGKPMQRSYALILSVILLSILAGGSSLRLARAQSGSLPAPQAALGPAFTYQGRLVDGGKPANGSYDLRFILYTAESGGNQVGMTVLKENVGVNEGYFTVLLDFGTVFDGQALWLEVSVRPGASIGAYTPLSPRQIFSAAPYAAYSLKAPWSGLAGIPASFADGVDNDTTYTAGDGLILSGGQFSVSFAGSGSANSAARSDHNHLGQTWMGSENPLKISGSFNTLDNWAPLVLSNTSGDGLIVNSAGGDGVHIRSVDQNGVDVISADQDGVHVSSAGQIGVFVGTVGSPSLNVVLAAQNGFMVGGAQGDGLFVDQADLDGVGVYYAGSPSSAVLSNAKNGFEVSGAQGYGLYVGRADLDGVYVNSTAWHGLNVAGAGVNGVYVTGAGNHGISVSGTNLAGYFNGNIQVTGSCTGCSIAAFGVNASSIILEPGDIVTVLGVQASGADSVPVLWNVAPASAGQTVVGVVQGRAELVTEQAKRPQELGKTLVPREASAAPGEYVTLIIYGPVQVKASGVVAVGERLVAGDSGTATALKTTEVNGIQLAENAPTIGITLSAPDENGLT
jgi:hypothetical protein